MRLPAPQLPGKRGRTGGKRGRQKARAPQQAARRADSAVVRVRAAGGPDDRACYACGCGRSFVEQVSTTVVCPHCGARQAW